jgi:hypothetical protein
MTTSEEDEMPVINVYGAEGFLSRARKKLMRPTLARMRFPLVAAVVVLALAVGGCVSTGVDSYEEFRSAVDSGATCEQLIDIQDNFDGTPDEARVADDLEEIGCDAPNSTRNDL